jgi:hypothetical protein
MTWDASFGGSRPQGRGTKRRIDIELRVTERELIAIRKAASSGLTICDIAG